MGKPWIYNAGECENCGHYDMEGDLKEGICRTCREAYPEDYADLDADEHPDCRLCQGTGIGQHGDPDMSKCHVCKGRGYILPKKESLEP